MNAYSIEDIKQAIAEANSDEIAVAFTGLVPDVPDWESFIMLIEKEIHDSRRTITPESPFEERIINGGSN